ncbi:hypothetical protein [Streptomyces griseus]|uniref:hypothetical protein n=1 Tax=Streptomyces griseus TaxID=1911 RepID=UPI00084074FD|nr:hypothetical protein [Streptomyces griseus]
MTGNPTKEDFKKLQLQTDQKHEEAIRQISALRDQLADQGQNQRETWTSDLETVRKEIADNHSTPGYGEAHLSGLPFTEDGAKIVNASNQLEYFSNQAFKWDMEALAVTPSGITLAGAQIYEFPWVKGIESSRLGVAGRAQRRTTAQSDDEDSGNGSGGSPPDRVADAREVELAQQTARGAQRYARELGEQLTRTKQALGRQLGTMHADLGTATRLAKSAHTRIDGINRQHARQSGTLRTAAAQPGVAANDPKKLSDAAAQIRALESRINSLARALS